MERAEPSFGKRSVSEPRFAIGAPSADRPLHGSPLAQSASQQPPRDRFQREACYSIINLFVMNGWEKCRGILFYVLMKSICILKISC